MTDLEAGSAVFLERVDFCVTTFKRPKAVERLILSIGEHYPKAAVFIADQNAVFDRDFYDRLGSRSGLARPPEIHRLAFDCGVSAARNHLVTTTPREYKLILDDDFVVTDRTKVELLVKLLDAHPNAGVCGGGVRWANGRVRNVNALLQIDGGTLVQQSAPSGRRLEQGDIRYTIVDYVSDFMLIRRELPADVCWDRKLKIFEHYDFFLRLMETPYEVLFTPDVVIDHLAAERMPGYQRFRGRHRYIVETLRKHGLTRMQVGASAIELQSDGTLVRFRDHSTDERVAGTRRSGEMV